jgi:hypothetical protein
MPVSWRLRFKCGLMNVAELTFHRGYEVGHQTIRSQVFRFGRLVDENLLVRRQGRSGRAWYFYRACVRVNGRWCYLHRAFDSLGQPAGPDAYVAPRKATGPPPSQSSVDGCQPAALAADDRQPSCIWGSHWLDHGHSGNTLNSDP